MVLTAHEAVKAAFADPQRWLAVLADFDTKALNLMIDDQHIVDEREAAAGQDFSNPGEGIKQLFAVLSLRQVFHLHCFSEERHNNVRLNAWEDRRQDLAMERVAQLMADMTYEEQLLQLRAQASKKYPMVGYQAQLFGVAGEIIAWPPGIKALAAILCAHTNLVGDDTEFQLIVDGWAMLIDLTLSKDADRAAA